MSGAINVLDVKTTKRLSIVLLAASGGLTFAAFNLVAAGVAAGNEQFAAKVSESFNPLINCLGVGLISFIMALLAEHPEMPRHRCRWSKRNMLESAFALISVMGLASLIWATLSLFAVTSITVD